MRIAILGDIHSNLEALQSVLADAESQGCSQYLCLGDVVGYGADPLACIQTIRSLGCPVIKGNHDEQASATGSLADFSDAAASFTYQHTPVCFYGHTHEPCLFQTGLVVKRGSLSTIRLQHGLQYLINVGSVGQPRDLDWRAAYVIYEPETLSVTLRRVPYDIKVAQEKIIKAGLPVELAERLALGK